jgi:alkanesulfonate monooxygenase SsuD/methylene tetrahydromethanopterin reductase-like flavin-dependent oxidoreductase (luciferase family)
MGAGWQQREHQHFGVPFYDFPTRFDMLTEALEITYQLLHSDQPVTFQGKHFSLEEAILLPRPQRKGGPPILIGGQGPKRALPLIAKYAQEWNANFLPLSKYKERYQQLDELLVQAGRHPQEVKRSLMTQLIFGGDDAELARRLRDRQAETLIANGLLVGRSSALVDQIGKWAEAGVERFMLQWMTSPG